MITSFQHVGERLQREKLLKSSFIDKDNRLLLNEHREISSLPIGWRWGINTVVFFEALSVISVSLIDSHGCREFYIVKQFVSSHTIDILSILFDYWHFSFCFSFRRYIFSFSQLSIKQNIYINVSHWSVEDSEPFMAVIFSNDFVRKINNQIERTSNKESNLDSLTWEILHEMGWRILSSYFWNTYYLDSYRAGDRKSHCFQA